MVASCGNSLLIVQPETVLIVRWHWPPRDTTGIINQREQDRCRRQRRPPSGWCRLQRRRARAPVTRRLRPLTLSGLSIARASRSERCGRFRHATDHGRRLGPLPLVNHFIQRIGVEDALDRYLPTDPQCAASHARALGVLLRSIIVEREPIYRQHETVHGFASGMFGMSTEEMQHLGDDRIGRALDRRFDADRGALLTEVVVTVGQRFSVKFDESHNDSTSISFCGNSRATSSETELGNVLLTSIRRGLAGNGLLDQAPFRFSREFLENRSHREIPHRPGAPQNMGDVALRGRKTRHSRVETIERPRVERSKGE